MPQYFVGYPFDGHDATVGNGTMTAFQFTDIKEVDTLHHLALESGGSDEGAPGFRPQYGEGFYAAYVRPGWQQVGVCGVPTPSRALTFQFLA